MTIPNQQPTAGPGFYLIIRYRETPISGGAVACWPASRAIPPYRYRLDPVLELTSDYPDPKQCKASALDASGDFNCGVVLALVRVTSACEIDKIETSFRQFSYPTHASRVMALAFEGEKDIDQNNPKTLRFDVRGAAPNSVSLYLRGAQFSTLYYTELGRHDHGIAFGAGVTADEQTSISHTHALQGASAANADGAGRLVGVHTHQVLLFGGPGTLVYRLEGGINILPPWFPRYRLAADTVPTENFRRNLIDDAGDHGHSLTGPTQGAVPATSGAHHHALSAIASLTGVRGMTPAARTNGDGPRGFLDSLTVQLDDVDITADLLGMLGGAPSGWKSIGDASSGHPLNTKGSGALDLLRIPGVAKIDVGPHQLVFSVPSGGGKLLWNLYIE